MAAKKKAKKASKAAKAKKAPARKAKKTAKKAAKRPARKAKKTAKKSLKAVAKKAPAKKAKSKPRKTIGEGDYAASRRFDRDEASFVKKNKAAIPDMGKEAEKALDGPEGADLREAEATAAARSRDIF